MKDHIVYGNVHCIADKETDLYTQLTNASQAATPWAHMAYYGKYVSYFLAGCVFLATMKHFLFTNYSVDRKHGGSASIWEKAVGWSRFVVYRQIPTNICRYLGLPSSVGSLLIVAAVSLYSMLFCFVPHPLYRACLGFGSPPMAVRAGLISMAFTPYIFIMSGKTNLIGFLTGISYEKLNKYHQLSSVLCLFFAWVHTLPYYIQSYREGGTHGVRLEMNSHLIYYTGIPPIVLLTLLWMCSWQFMRDRWYQFFISFHWLLAVCFYISLFYHVYNELQGHWYLVATIIVWGGQLLYRWFVKGYLRPGRVMKQVPAELVTHELLGRKSVQLQVDLPLECAPGQHIFLRTLDQTFMQSHPFSVIPNKHGFKLIVRVYNGFTKHLFEKASSSKQILVLVDGPYGGLARDPASFSNIYLVCSGSGITTCMPFIMRYLRHLDNPSATVSQIRLDWIVKQVEDVFWVEAELNQIYLSEKKPSGLEINVYCANPSEIKPLLGPRYHFFKPCPDEILKSYTLGSTNCIVCSGSETLKKQVANGSAALQSNIGKVREIYLHTEEFGL
ncbi:hypothetical protein OGAPHI_006871 [Ogataea philodendri]|uniref:ferric-chelate reductase (NADPH) n=1 Tax=Ogataea philodendri TaxID=1378263 RepID=A0A9P8NV54_9ASCO|nr:uncharacterized protein OGAPHI_006871 [Ogataea philodendri]KAH3660285.1 hypothetical protein OGAPHI_006871 [Ogataea philodendri]